MTAMKTPFHFDLSGRVALTRHYGEEVQQRVIALLRTVVRERMMRPDFGSMIHTVLFEPNDHLAHAALEQQITDAIDLWEDEVSVESLTLTPDDNEPSSIRIILMYRLIGQGEGSDTLQEAVVNYNGALTEVG